jgi:AraC-like DNA-binding protein
VPSTSVRTFDDPTDYGANVRAANTELFVVGRGQFSAKLTRIDLHRVWMQHYSDTLPRIARAKPTPTRVVISIPTRPESAPSWGGQDVPWGSVYQLGLGQEIIQRSRGRAEWTTMSLPLEEYRSAVSTLADREPRCPTFALTHRPSAPAVARLQYLHAAASHLAEFAPKVLENAEATRSLEQELILAMVDCTTSGQVENDSSSLHKHQHIMRRFHALIEANAEKPLYLPEMCTALGISYRTLLRCCHEQIGISPHRYLWLRRMNMARHALLQSDHVRESVTQGATNNGFWELGRFATAYRAFFGESPSETLHRQA